MKYALKLFLVVVLTHLVHDQLPDGLKSDKEVKNNATQPLKEMEWMLATWQRKTRSGPMFEEWKQISPKIFAGTGFVTGKEGQRVVMEEILLTEMGGELFYIPKTQGNEFPVPFKLVSKKKNKLVFENPKHDFPQRIEYQLLAEGQLKATISDLKRNKEIPFSFSKQK